MRKYIFAIVASALAFVGCEKDEPISPIPQIEVKQVAPSPVQAYSDTLTFTIFYKDGDGDLGENNANVYNLFLTDNRNQVTYKYRIQQLDPGTAPLAIQGNLLVKLPSVPLLNGGSSETVTYSVYVTDRAGNKSNTATSQPITVNQ